MNLNINLREKILLFILGVVLILIVGIQFLIMPAAESLTKNSASFVNTQLQKQAAELDVQRTKSISQTISKSYEDANKAASVLLPPIDKASLHVWLFGIAEKSGLGVKSAVFSDPVASTPATVFTGQSKSSGESEKSTSSGSVEYNMKSFADMYAGKTTKMPEKSTGANPSASSSTSSSSSPSSSPSSSASATSPFVNGDAMMVNVDLELSGTYSQANAFLDAIKNTKRSVIVSAFTYKIDKDNKFTVTISLQCYGAQKLDTSDKLFGWTLPAPAGQKDLM